MPGRYASDGGIGFSFLKDISSFILEISVSE